MTTNYLPLNPPGFESAVMALVGQQIRLYLVGLCWYLDEDAMVWRKLDWYVE